MKIESKLSTILKAILKPFDIGSTNENFELAVVYTPEDCTDLCAVTDDGLGFEIKRRMVKYYKDDLCSSDARLEAWKNGKVPVSERRILATQWLSRAWKSYCKDHQAEITKAFKHCGMYNAIDGSESHLIRLRKWKVYKTPAKDDNAE